MRAATWQNQQCGCAPRKDSDQPGHPPSLIRVFAVRMKIAWVLSYPLSAQRRLWSDWTHAQADLSICWSHTHFVGFVTSWLIWVLTKAKRSCTKLYTLSVQMGTSASGTHEHSKVECTSVYFLYFAIAAISKWSPQYKTFIIKDKTSSMYNFCSPNISNS